MEMDEEQFLSLRNYQFLTLKPLILVVNAPEQKIGDTVVLSKITSCYSFPAFQVSAALEEEISHLEEKDRASFMQEMGIAESALQKMTRAAFSGLGYISFFSVGEDEVRAWPLRKGALAVKAGGVIHSDIEKGFVRAELMKYEELMAAGSEQRLKETGKLYLKGRDYVVEDGDIMNFRFNV
jgi:ribosome-binding ATPase YchF (GTP1/OBG family)